jgi:hypothetical protein
MKGGPGTNWENPPRQNEGGQAGQQENGVDETLRPLRKADANGDGIVDETEKAQMKENFGQALKKQADQNQDGVVDKAEKERMRKIWQKGQGQGQNGNSRRGRLNPQGIQGAPQTIETAAPAGEAV